MSKTGVNSELRHRNSRDDPPTDPTDPTDPAAQVFFKCDPGYSSFDGDDHIICTSEGTWFLDGAAAFCMGLWLFGDPTKRETRKNEMVVELRRL